MEFQEARGDPMRGSDSEVWEVFLLSRCQWMGFCSWPESWSVSARENVGLWTCPGRLH